MEQNQNCKIQYGLKTCTAEHSVREGSRTQDTYKTDLSISAEIQNLAVLPNNPKPARVSELLVDLDHWAGRLTPGSYSSDDLLFWLVAKLPR